MSKKEPRIRVCGLLLRQDALLMVKIQPPTRNHPIWMPPGGRLHFGEALQDGVRREITEETQLKVKVGHLVFIHQFIEAPFHALEFYFYCSDEDKSRLPEIVEAPENKGYTDILLDIDFVSFDKLKKLDIEPRHLMDFTPEAIVKPSSENLTLYSSF